MRPPRRRDSVRRRSAKQCRPPAVHRRPSIDERLESVVMRRIALRIRTQPTRLPPSSLGLPAVWWKPCTGTLQVQVGSRVLTLTCHSRPRSCSLAKCSYPEPSARCGRVPPISSDACGRIAPVPTPFSNVRKSYRRGDAHLSAHRDDFPAADAPMHRKVGDFASRGRFRG